MIEVKSLTKKFAQLEAVKDITFQVPQGTIWGFLGPNGAGKTTTMRILTGFLPPTSGSAAINGIDVVENPFAVKKMVGYLPEIVPVYPELTVREYLYYVAELFRIEKKKLKKAVDTAVERTGLEKVYKRLIKNISRGYRQRLGIAQAIIHEPQVLILDEPTVGLDPAQIVEIRDMIRSLKESATIILSSHILAEITQVCDGAVIIKDGQLKAYLKREEWSKNLEIVTSGNLQDFKSEELQESFPFLSDIQIDENNLKLEFREPVQDINRLLKFLLEKDIKIREIKAGLEALYLKIIAGEEGRAQ